MATRNKKNSNSQVPVESNPERKPEHVSEWRTPAGIAIILGALATLITALVGVYNAVEKKASQVTPTLSPQSTAIILRDPCTGYFEGYVTEVQAGTPAVVDLVGYDLAIIKLMDNTVLIGSIKYVPVISTVLIADENCRQLQKPTKILPDTENEFDLGDFTATYTLDIAGNKLNIAFKKK